MTPNQVEGIGRAVAELLTEAHEGGGEPCAHPAVKVRRSAGFPAKAWRVEVYATSAEGDGFTLASLVTESGEAWRLDARGLSQRSDRGTSETSDETRPGVRVDQDGEAQYSSEWLNDR